MFERCKQGVQSFKTKQKIKKKFWFIFPRVHTYIISIVQTITLNIKKKNFDLDLRVPK
jgi:hypothetical protein